VGPGAISPAAPGLFGLAVGLFFLVGIAAVVLLVARRHPGTWASAVAGGSGLVASLGDLSINPSLRSWR
jgi:hypothetical protein